jgi:hypothetical protein
MGKLNVLQREKLKNACQKILSGKCENTFMTRDDALDILYEYTSAYFTDGNKRNINIEIEETEDTETLLYIALLVLKKGRRDQKKFEQMKEKKREDNRTAS